MAKLQRPVLKPVEGRLKTWEELLNRNELPQDLDVGDLFQDLSPEEESIIEEILNSPAIQVRLKALLISLVMSNLEGKLKWIPFKGMILAKVWEELMKQLNALVDRAEEWYRNRRQG